MRDSQRAFVGLLAIAAALPIEGCGGPPARHPSSAPPRSAAPARRAEAEAPPAAKRSSIRLALPDRRACELSTTDWDAVPPLRVTATARPYGHVKVAKEARVVFPIDGRDPILEVELGSIVVRSAAPSSDLPLFADRPLLLGGLMIPKGGTELVAEGAGAERLRVALPAIPSELADLSTSLEAVASCDQVKLVPTGFDPWSVLGKGEPNEVVLGRGTEVALAAGGSSVATTDSSAPVRVLERARPFARIAWEITPGVIVGWVEQGAIRKAAIPPRVRIGSSRFVGPPVHEKTLFRMHCPAEVPLGVMAEPEPVFIGAVHAGAVIDVVTLGGDGRAVVEIYGAPLKVSEGVRLFVPSADLEGCTKLSDLE